MYSTTIQYNLKADLFQLCFFSFELIFYEEEMTFSHEGSKE